jgi:hypothetical protein
MLQLSPEGGCGVYSKNWILRCAARFCMVCFCIVFNPSVGLFCRHLRLTWMFRWAAEASSSRITFRLVFLGIFVSLNEPHGDELYRKSINVIQYSVS